MTINNNNTMHMNIETKNLELKAQSPEDIIHWAISNSNKPIITTSFSPYSAVLLHMVTSIKPDIPVLWVDNGYNTNATYRFVKKVHQQLHLNLNIFSPEITTAYRNAVLGGVPDISEEEDHQAFTEEVKLNPFRKAMQNLKPDLWLNGIRQEETEFRKTLDIITTTKDNVLKVAPLFFWSDKDLEDYLEKYDLPNEMNYYDPTKASDTRECGLHFQI